LIIFSFLNLSFFQASSHSISIAGSRVSNTAATTTTTRSIATAQQAPQQQTSHVRRQTSVDQATSEIKDNIAAASLHEDGRIPKRTEAKGISHDSSLDDVIRMTEPLNKVINAEGKPIKMKDYHAQTSYPRQDSTFIKDTVEKEGLLIRGDSSSK